MELWRYYNLLARARIFIFNYPGLPRARCRQGFLAPAKSKFKSIYSEQPCGPGGLAPLSAPLPLPKLEWIQPSTAIYRFFRVRTILHLLKCGSWFSCDLICTISGISCIIIILCISSITIAVVLINRRNSSSTMLMLESKPEPTEMAATEKMWVFR